MNVLIGGPWVVYKKMANSVWAKGPMGEGDVSARVKKLKLLHGSDS